MKKWLALHKVDLVLTGLVILLVFVFLAPSIFISIHSGESGVAWLRFGGGTVTAPPGGGEFRARLGFDENGDTIEDVVHFNKRPVRDAIRSLLGDESENTEDDFSPFVDYPYSEGLRLKFPWDKMFIYNIRLQERQVEYDVLAKDGLHMSVSISIRWKPIEADLGKLHQDIGPNYPNSLIIPIVGAFAREEIGKFNADDLYAEQRLKIQENILSNVQEAMVHKFYPASERESLVRIENILIREIVLPKKVRDAIQDKVEQKHLADAYVYRLDREEQEADRKAIEAQGIRRFQEEINGSITEEFLRWKGIDATLELAKSNNAKIVVIGAGDEGLPIILGGLDSPAQSPAVVVGTDTNSDPTQVSDLDSDPDPDLDSKSDTDSKSEPGSGTKSDSDAAGEAQSNAN